MTAPATADQPPVTLDPTLPRYRLTRELYDRMVKLGILTTRDKVELMGGELVAMSPMYSPHATGVSLCVHTLETIIGEEHYVRSHMPLACGGDSEPEPDIAVVPGTIRDYAKSHPTTAVLIVEVADSSLAYDRRTKGSLYARSGIADYWVENIGAKVLEVYRNPVPDPTAAFGYSYAESRRLGPDERIAPLAFPSASILIGDLLP